MVKRVVVLALMALGAGACATEHRTVLATADDACTRYGFTAATVDHVRCQEQVELARRSNRVAAVETESQLAFEADSACEAYGVSRGTAQFIRCIRDEFVARRPG